MWNGGWEVDDAREVKFLSGEKQPRQPLKYENDLYHCGPRERFSSRPAEQKLAIAEAYAFGAATSRNIEGRFLSALDDGKSEGQADLIAVAQYNHFLVEHTGAIAPGGAGDADRLALRRGAQLAGRRFPSSRVSSSRPKESSRTWTMPWSGSRCW